MIRELRERIEECRKHLDKPYMLYLLRELTKEYHEKTRLRSVK